MSRILKLSFVACLLIILFFRTGAANATALSCGNWQVIASPNPGSEGDRLFGVTAINADNVWAVGYDYTPLESTGPSALIEHWNGTVWTVVPNPSSPLYYYNLFDASAVSASDIWAVGSSLDMHGKLQSLTEHWDGTGWSVVPNPGLVELDAVEAVSTDDVWVSGNYLIEHWDSTQWSIAHISDGNMLGLAAVSANDIWGVGGSYRGGNQSATLIEHWNGKRWVQVQSPTPVGAYQGLWGVTAISANNVWAVGSYDKVDLKGDLKSQTLIEHWDGKVWSIVPSPSSKSDLNALYAVTATSANDVWATGDHLIEHWDGTTWSIVPETNGVLNDVKAVPGTGQVWAVGVNNNDQTLTEFYC